MTTNPDPKDHQQKDDKQPSTTPESSQEKKQEDELHLDSDLEMEDLVDSITTLEENIKKK